MRWSLWLAFIAFCLLSSAGWLFPPLAPEPLPPLVRLALIFGALGGVGLVLCLGQRRRELPLFYLTMAGLGFFGLPAVFFEWGGGSLSGFSRSVGFAAAPVVVILVMAFAGRDEVRRLLLPALAGLGGVLLLLPFPVPSSVRGWWMLAGLLAVMVLVAALSVWMNDILKPFRLAEAVAVVGLSNALFLLFCAALSGSVAWQWSTLVSAVSISFAADAAGVVLILWLLREMAPVRLAARYLVIPLLTVLEGYVILRPEPTVRISLGAALLAVGAGVILFSREAGDEAILSLK